jgi:hypothetical protein
MLNNYSNKGLELGKSIVDLGKSLVDNATDIGIYAAAGKSAAAVVQSMTTSGPLSKTAAAIATAGGVSIALKGTQMAFKELNKSSRINDAIKDSKFVKSERDVSPDNEFGISSVLEDLDKNITNIFSGDTPLEVLIGIIFIFAILALIFNTFLLYQVFFRYILKSNYDNIINIYLRLFKSKDREYIENKLNKILNINSAFSFIFFIIATIVLIWVLIMIIFISYTLKSDLDGFCDVHSHIKNNLMPIMVIRKFHTATTPKSYNIIDKIPELKNSLSLIRTKLEYN